MTNQRFAVHFDRRPVGTAARVPGGFVFYASDHRFDALNGKAFRRLQTIERKLSRIAGREPPPPSLAQASLAFA